MTYSPDVVRCKVVITQNALNLQGWMMSSYFEEAPNDTFRFVDSAVGAIVNTPAMNITLNELSQNIGAVRRT